MSVYAGRIKFVRRLFVRSFGHYDINEIQHRARQLCTSFTPAQHPPPSLPPACMPAHWQWLATCSGLSSLSTYLLPRLLLLLLLPLPMSARLHGAHGPRPLHSQQSHSPFPYHPSTLYHLPSHFLLSPSFTCPAAHFALISSQLCMQKCNVLLVFYLPNPLTLPPATAPACWHFIACFIQQRFVSLSHSLSHSATVKMKCAKCTLSTAFINILVLVGRAYLVYIK